MQLLRRIVSNAFLFTPIRYLFHQKPGDRIVSTPPKTMEPFKVGFLTNNPGYRRNPKVVGRGPGSGKGKTSGRGFKGHKARSGGGTHVRFEGGQTPITQRSPKYGKPVQKRPKEIFDYVNLEKIDYYIRRGVLDPKKTITIKALVDAGIVKKVKFGVKILARGAELITYPLHIEASDASKVALERVESQGGIIELVYRTPLKLRAHMYPEKYPLPLREPIPPFWRVKKLQRLEQSKGTPIVFRKPKWLQVKEAAQSKPVGTLPAVSKFVFPVPRVQNSGKIRKRRVKLYRVIDYNLP